LTYKPEFKGPVEGYSVNFITKNLWRVEAGFQIDDLKQEAYVVFLRCVRLYPHLETPQHFMALFKTAWTNHFNDLARIDGKLRQCVSTTLADGSVLELAGVDFNDGELAVKLRQAPPEVVAVLNLFLSAPTEILELLLGSFRSGTIGNRNHRDGGSSQINKALGFPEGYNSIEEVRRYLS